MTVPAAEVATGDYALVEGTFTRVTAAEFHTRTGMVMVCYADGRPVINYDPTDTITIYA